MTFKEGDEVFPIEESRRQKFNFIVTHIFPDNNNSFYIRGTFHGYAAIFEANPKDYRKLTKLEKAMK